MFTGSLGINMRCVCYFSIQSLQQSPSFCAGSTLSFDALFVSTSWKFKVLFTRLLFATFGHHDYVQLFVYRPWPFLLWGVPGLRWQGSEWNSIVGSSYGTVMDFRESGFHLKQRMVRTESNPLISLEGSRYCCKMTFCELKDDYTKSYHNQYLCKQPSDWNGWVETCHQHHPYGVKLRSIGV